MSMDSRCQFGKLYLVVYNVLIYTGKWAFIGFKAQTSLVLSPLLLCKGIIASQPPLWLALINWLQILRFINASLWIQPH